MPEKLFFKNILWFRKTSLKSFGFLEMALMKTIENIAVKQL